MTLTPLDREAVRRAFDQAAPQYDRHAVLQHEVEARLLERLDVLPAAPADVLDIGCGTGGASDAMQRRWPGARVVALDWSLGMLGETGARCGDRVLRVCADLLRLPLAARRFDLVFSSLALQWVTDLPRALAEMRRVLRPGGLLLFTSFGPDTLRELRAAWAAVDDRPHVNEHPDLHDVGDILVAGGFRDPVMDAERIVMDYPDPLALMRELKAIGAHNAARERAPGLTGPGALKRVLAAYEGFRRDGRYPATFEVVYGTAWGAAEGQPVRDAGGGEEATFSVDALRGSLRR